MHAFICWVNRSMDEARCVVGVVCLMLVRVRVRVLGRCRGFPRKGNARTPAVFWMLFASGADREVDSCFIGIYVILLHMRDHHHAGCTLDGVSKHFEVPRIHFAINCASVSCPILRNEAFTSDKLEEQLKEQAVYFVNKPIKNKITSQEIALSPIFNWFESDFTKKGDVLSFIQAYTEVELDAKIPVTYLDYDWNINE